MEEAEADDAWNGCDQIKNREDTIYRFVGPDEDNDGNENSDNNDDDGDGDIYSKALGIPTYDL